MVRLDYDKLYYDTVTKKAEFYDLATDPGEQRDLSAQEQEKLDMLMAELERFLSHEGAGKPMPAPDAATMELLKKLGYADE